MKFNISRTHARALEARAIPTVGLETACIDARNRAWSSSAILLFRKTGSAASYRSFFGTHGRHVVPTVRLPERRNSLRFPFVPVSLFSSKASIDVVQWDVSLTFRTRRVPFQSNLGSNPDRSPFDPKEKGNPMGEGGRCFDHNPRAAVSRRTRALVRNVDRALPKGEKRNATRAFAREILRAGAQALRTRPNQRMAVASSVGKGSAVASKVRASCRSPRNGTTLCDPDSIQTLRRGRNAEAESDVRGIRDLGIERQEYDC